MGSYFSRELSNSSELEGCYVQRYTLAGSSDSPVLVELQGRKLEIASPVRMMGFHGGSSGKESSYNAGDLGSIPELGRSPGEENGYPLLPGQFHGQRSLVGYSPIICSILY